MLLGAAAAAKKVIEEQKRREEERRRRENAHRRQQEERKAASDRREQVRAGENSGATVHERVPGVSGYGADAAGTGRLNEWAENGSNKIEMPKKEAGTKADTWKQPAPQPAAWDTVFQKTIEKIKENSAQGARPATNEENTTKREPIAYRPWEEQPKIENEWWDNRRKIDHEAEVLPEDLWAIQKDAGSWTKKDEAPLWNWNPEGKRVYQEGEEEGQKPNTAADDFWAADKELGFERGTAKMQPNLMWDRGRSFDEDVPRLEALFTDAWEDSKKRGVDKDQIAQAIWREVDGNFGMEQGKKKNGTQSAVEMVYNGGNAEGNFSNIVIKDYEERYISDEEAKNIKRTDEQTNHWGKLAANVALTALLKGAAKGGYALLEKAVPAILGGATIAKEGYDIANDDYKEPKAGNYIEATVVIGQVNDQSGKKIYPAREIKIRVCADDFENSAINQFLPTTL